MPWTKPVDQRFAFVTECLTGKRSMSALCELYGVSRKTGYKWLRRFKGGGRAALENRLRTPHSSPNAVSDEVKAEVLALRREHPTWGTQEALCAPTSDLAGARGPGDEHRGSNSQRSWACRRGDLSSTTKGLQAAQDKEGASEQRPAERRVVLGFTHR